AASDARLEVERAIRLGDSSAATLVLAGELLAGAGRYRDAERAYRAAARDSALGALAIYRRARILARLGDAGAPEALSGFAQSFAGDTAAPTALYVLGDMLADRGEWAEAARWFDELIARYPADLRASLARFRLAAQALRDSLRDSASALFRAEVAAGAPPRMGGRRSRTSTRSWRGVMGSRAGASGRRRCGSVGRPRSRRPTTRASCAPSSPGPTAAPSRERRRSSASTRCCSSPSCVRRACSMPRPFLPPAPGGWRSCSPARRR